MSVSILWALRSSATTARRRWSPATGAFLRRPSSARTQAHQPYGGVVPEIAARAHVEILPALIRGVLDDAKLSIHDVDAVAATAGPGLIGGVMVALLAGKGLALAAGKPLIAVNHLEGHALSPAAGRSGPRLSLPAAARVGRPLPVARGRAASAITAASPRPSTMRRARRSTRPPSCSASAIPAARRSRRWRKAAIQRAVPLPRPLVGSGEPHFSFAGLKSAVQRAVASGDYEREDIAASFQQAVVDCLVDRTALALAQDRRAGAGRRRRSRRQPARSAPRLPTLAERQGRALQRPAGLALHRQCGDDRLGRRRALRRGADATRSTLRRGRAGRSIRSAEKVRGAGVKA